MTTAPKKKEETIMQDKVYQRLAGNARRLSPSRDSDAFHDAWLETGHDDYRHLCARAKLRAIDAIRASRRAVPPHLAQSKINRQLSSEEDLCPLSQLIKREQCSIVRTAVDHLEPLYREIATLCLIDELPMAEIASQLDVPVKTLYTRLDRAKAQLRVALQRVEDAR